MPEIQSLTEAEIAALRALLQATPEPETDAFLYAVRTDDTKAMHVYQPVQFAEAPEWSPFLPVPGVYHHPIYGELNYTAETYDRIIEHFKDGIYQERLPVNAEHDPHAAGAVGWITGMRLADSGAIEVKVEWNDRGRALIEGDRYKYVSAELYPWWTDPVDPERNYQDVAVGMAITTTPYFKTSVLPPLVASEAVLTRVAGNGTEVIAMSDKDETQDVQEEPAVTTTDTNDQPADVQETQDALIAQLTEQFSGKKIGDPLVTEFVAKIAHEVAAARQEAETARREANQYAERNAVLQVQNRVKFFTDEVTGRSDQNGTAWTGAGVADHVRMACSLAEKFGESSWELQHYIQTNRAQAEQVKAGSLFSEIGSARNADGGLTAYDQIAALATETMKTTGQTFAQAFDDVLTKNHELRTQYGRESR